METVIFRTNGDVKTGLGHIYRMKKLADEFNEKKFKVIFIVDNHNYVLEKILNYEKLFLYKKGTFKSQTEDAKKVHLLIKNENVKLIVIDDYRLDYRWEKFFFKKIKLVVFDDLNIKKHLCDFLVDCKWIGPETYNRYKNLVPVSCKRILGSQYCFIDRRLKKIKSKKKNLLLYFGGGGNLDNFYELTKNICIFNKEKNNKKYRFNIKLVIGPMSKNYLKIIKLENKFENLELIKNKFDLSKTLNKTALYFGVSSSIIYDLAYLNIPACVFSLSKNQINNTKALEDIGIYFNLKLNKSINKKIPILLNVFFNNIEKLKSISSNSNIKIDSKGSLRVFNIINKNLKPIKQKKFLKTKNKTKKIGYYPVKDNMINEYLYLRNLNINRRKSINISLIQKIDHYIWWFQTKRKSFYLIKDRLILLVLYQEKISILKHRFWYGGWFVGGNKINLIDIFNAIKWQIKRTLKEDKIKWIAIIKKTNNFVYRLNSNLGFVKIENEDIYKKRIISNLKLNNKDYHFLIK